MKSVYKVFILIHLFIFSLFAQVNIKAPSSFVQNEPYYFTIEANGENIKFPTIDTINSFSVQEAGQSRSISNINGVITSKYIKRYQLYPSGSFSLPSFDVQIDGTTFHTKPIKVQEVKRQQTVSQYFEFNILPSKKELYVGESTLLTLQFKHRSDVKIVDYKLHLDRFENFWHKSLEENRQYKEGDYIVQELDFLLFPQKSGLLKIPPVNMEVVVLDMNNAYSFFGNNTKKIKVYSNELSFDVQALPSGTTLVGDFQISASIDKIKIAEGESVNYQINIKGTGNIDDVQDIQLKIPNVTIYANKPIIKTKIESGKYQGSYTKSFSILPNENLQIPSIELSFFNPTLQQLQAIRTEPFNIEVSKNVVQNTAPVLQKAKVQEKVSSEVIIKSNPKDKLLFFCLGVLVSLLSVGLYFYVINKKTKNKDDTPLVQRIKQAKNKENLIIVMLPYLDTHDEIKHLVFKIENEQTINLKAYKKMLLNLVKTYHIKG